ncbi:MAG TPA: hypothetical protein DCW47_09965, partial [Lachnospiraceae bacterium]|nr:hypothetical protein [Lachnospiraceae bacterium]
GHFVDGQTCYGLDKLILNNNYADATNMKEAVIYDMFQYLGATASLYNYASVSLNGEYKGVYLALEGVEKSFMLRNFGTRDGELYKPDSMEVGDNRENEGEGGPMPMGEGGFKPGEYPPEGFEPGNAENTQGIEPGNTENTQAVEPGNTEDTQGAGPENMSGMTGSDTGNVSAVKEAGQNPDEGGPGNGKMRGGPSMSGKGSDL